MEKQIDLLKYLSRIVRENTRHYQSDLAYDRKALQQAAQAQVTPIQTTTSPVQPMSQPIQPASEPTETQKTEE